MCFACSALVARSFTETVIVGQLDRNPQHLQTILKARNVCYHLFSLLFVSCVAFATKKDDPNDPDPLVEKEHDAVGQAKDFILNRLEDLTAGRKRTAPPFKDLLDELKNNPALSYPEMAFEITELDKRYGDWEPVFRWSPDPKDTDPRPPNTSYYPVVTPVNKIH